METWGVLARTLGIWGIRGGGGGGRGNPECVRVTQPLSLASERSSLQGLLREKAENRWSL